MKIAKKIRNFNDRGDPATITARVRQGRRPWKSKKMFVLVKKSDFRKAKRKVQKYIEKFRVNFFRRRDKEQKYIWTKSKHGLISYFSCLAEM